LTHSAHIALLWQPPTTLNPVRILADKCDSKDPNIFRDTSFGTFSFIKFHGLTLVEFFIVCVLQGGRVKEYVTVFRVDEPKSSIGKFLDRTLRHFRHFSELNV
jgi:hypothetical protein